MSIVEIPFEFFDAQMAPAGPVFSLIYILIKRYGETDELYFRAKAIGYDRQTVTEALDYWKRKDIPSVALEKRPHFTPSELEKYQQSCPEIRALFVRAETILGRALSYNDLNSLLSFYEWHKLPIAVIETLLTYCVENGHTNLRYIEKVAMDWDDNGITTVQAAEARITLFTNEYRQILQAFGIVNRTPVKTEQKYMKKWLTEWAVPMEVVVEACERTVLSTGSVSFKYADSILKKWHQASIKTLADVAKADEVHEAQKAEKAQKTKSTSSSPTPRTKNRFANYDQRIWDFDAIERLEQDKIAQDLGNNP